MSDGPSANQRQTGAPPVSVSADREDDQDEAIDGTPLYRKKHVVIPLAIAILLVAGGYWYYVTQIRGYDSTDDAFIDGNRVALSSKILGRIIQLGVDEGDTVHAGEVIVRLDTADIRSQEAQAAAAVEDARQGVALARVNLDRASDDYQRAETQFKTHVIPKEQFDHARSALAVAQSQLKIAETRTATTAAQLGVVRTQLQNTEIHAPMNGVVAKRFVLAGDVVQPGQPIVTIYDLGSVWVTANFEETKLNALRIGDSVDISIDAYPDRPLRGAVWQFGASTASQFSLIPPNNASGNFTKVTQRVPVKISIDRNGANDPGHPLLPGMSVEVRVKTRGR